MDELLLGLTDGKHVEALERQLEQMPEGVEEMYQRILDRIEPCRRAEAAMLLHMIMHDERSEVGVEISRLYAALRSMPLETALKDKVVPVIEENNDGRILALLGDFLDYIEPPDELLQNECPLLLIFEGNRLTRRRGYLARVSLTHETLVPFLSASQWLDTNLPFTFSAPGGEFWLRLYAEEIDRCSVGTNITVTDVVARVIAFAASMEEHHRGYQKNSETNWAIVSGELLEALESWPRWTPLLPFALKDIPRQIRRVTADRLACLSTLHGIIENPLFLYHWFICKYRDWEATAFAVEHQWSDQCIRPWLHNFRRTDSLERSFKEIGPDITLAISHRLPRLLQSRMNCGRMSLAVEQQQLFDYAWKYFTAKHSWPPHFNERMETLALLLSWGCQIDSRQLCQLLKRGHYASFQEWQSIIELFSASLVQIALHEGAHDISCPASKVENVSRHGQGSSFLCHWAVTKLTKENREGVTSLLYFLLAQGEQVDSMNNYQEDPILVVILTRSLGRHCGALHKIVTVLQAGADVGAVGRNGTALDAAKRRVEECDLGRYPELHEQAEAALQLVQYCVDHNGALPANLDNYLERDLW
ncbi:hypothetical protein OHC33_010234 [Knufia fluminis]|uniref:Uncharacterized protein n=1 Tax=Knufia fluminis TaxID=191047 RepID=A0AAN8EG49_9EURO|nr:hypothetical protein OHC33_010234 [Knufia fluminis]